MILAMAVWCWGWGAGWQDREHVNYGIPFYDWKTRFERFSDALEISRRLLDQTEPVSFDGFHISVRRRGPAATAKTPYPHPDSGAMDPSAPFHWPHVSRTSGMGLISMPTVSTKENRRLTELIEAAGRDPATVKRSLMLPFEWVRGDDAVDVLAAYIEAGCERFMIQITEYDNLDPVEEWASRHLASFS